MITSKKYAKFKGPDQDNCPAGPSLNTAGCHEAGTFVFMKGCNTFLFKVFFPQKFNFSLLFSKRMNARIPYLYGM